MDVEKMFKEYRNWKRDMGIMEFDLSRFEGMPYDDVIRGLCLSRPQGERVQESGTSDRTGKAAVIYRQVKEKMDDEWFEHLVKKYEATKEEKEFFEYAIRQLSGRLPEVIWDMVVNEMTWRELTEKYNVSETMIAKYRKKAIAEMEALYRMRAETAESYFLG